MIPPITVLGGGLYRHRRRYAKRESLIKGLIQILKGQERFLKMKRWNKKIYIPALLFLKGEYLQLLNSACNGRKEKKILLWDDAGIFTITEMLKQLTGVQKCGKV